MEISDEDVHGYGGAGGDGEGDQADAGADDGWSIAREVDGRASGRQEIEGQDVDQREDYLAQAISCGMGVRWISQEG